MAISEDKVTNPVLALALPASMRATLFWMHPFLVDAGVDAAALAGGDTV